MKGNERERMEMCEAMTRMKLCTMKAERTIGMLNGVYENLEELEQELKDLDELTASWLDMDESEE